jgi:hypothetical protein
MVKAPARAAPASRTAPEKSSGLGHNPAAATANKPAPAARAAGYHHAGELPCALITRK